MVLSFLTSFFSPTPAPPPPSANVETPRRVRIASRAPSDPISQELRRIEDLIHHLLKKSPLEAQQNAFLALSTDTQKNLSYWVWVAHGCPEIEDYGKTTILASPSKLLSVSLPLIYSRGRDLLEQRYYYLGIMQQIDSRPEKKQSLLRHLREEQRRRFLSLTEDPTLKKQQLYQCYQSLSPDIQGNVPSPPHYGYGIHNRLYEHLGAHPTYTGTRFALEAPHAERVFVITTYEGREQKRIEMQRKSDRLWEIEAEHVGPGTTYQYEVHKEGRVLRKIDPFATENWCYHSPHFHYESVVSDPSHFAWEDGDWMETRKRLTGSCLPMSIYKIHIGTWKKRGDRALNYRELAEEITHYCLNMGFSHVELMGLLEHPNEGSQGYHPLSLFSPNSRHGTPSDFQHLVNTLHKHGIGVIIDFVSDHFCDDDFSLKTFDGTPLFEHPDTRRSFHPDWRAWKFNYEDPFIRNYVHSAANSWAQRFHVDGFRIDAFDATLDTYNDRREVNPSSVLFFRDMNASLHRVNPGVFTIAESSAHRNLSAPVCSDGYGFDAKWAMGGMFDLLEYFQKDPIYRKYHHNNLIQALTVDRGDRVVYPFSHDQVSHGSKGLLHKMPGDPWQKFANLRLFFSLVFCLPGRKLLFMGSEVGQWEGWDEKLRKSLYENRHLEGVDWGRLSDEQHRGLQNTVRALNKLYKDNPSLWETDICSEVKWIDNRDQTNSVISFHRQNLACIMNCTPNYFSEYNIYFPDPKEEYRNISSMDEIFNSDRKEFGGSGKISSHATLLKDDAGNTVGFKIQLPPLACVIFKEKFR